MKNKEAPSIDLTPGNPSMPAARQIPDCLNMETTGSTVRQDGAASALIEKRALSLFSESLMEAMVDQANVEQAWRNVKANRGAPWARRPK
jgi:RNA-directed DNA polymerase